MKTHFSYGHTRLACYIGYIIQSAVNTLPPLLFLTFQREFSISLEAITMLITLNFGTQLLTDLTFSKVADRIGYRAGALLSHALAFLGLFFYGFLPYTLENPYLGLAIATVTNAVGGGLAEVLISPIIESLPGEHKSAKMSLLHAMYCWGQVGVILLSTLYFTTIGTHHWRYLFFIWSLLPLFNFFFFTRVPLCQLVENEKRQPLSKLMKQGAFWILLMLMICSGAAEQAMAQWSSLFAESGLRVSKTMGDLLGPCAFAVLMGVSRTLYGVLGHRFSLERAMLLSGVGCIVSYLIAGLFRNPLLSLVGCGLCGLSVGLMWPGVISLAAKYFPAGGTALFAFLALGGDVGCTTGPGVTGMVSGVVSWLGNSEDALRIGLLAVIVFPVCMLLGLWKLYRPINRMKEDILQ